MNAGSYADDQSPGSPHHRFRTVCAIKLTVVLNQPSHETHYSAGTSAQSVKRSIGKRPNSESSSCSPLTAPRKKIRESAGSTKIENVVMDFPF